MNPNFKRKGSLCSQNKSIFIFQVLKINIEQAFFVGVPHKLFQQFCLPKWEMFLVSSIAHECIIFSPQKKEGKNTSQMNIVSWKREITKTNSESHSLNFFRIMHQLLFFFLIVQKNSCETPSNYYSWNSLGFMMSRAKLPSLLLIWNPYF